MRTRLLLAVAAVNVVVGVAALAHHATPPSQQVQVVRGASDRQSPSTTATSVVSTTIVGGDAESPAPAAPTSTSAPAPEQPTVGPSTTTMPRDEPAVAESPTIVPTTIGPSTSIAPGLGTARITVRNDLDVTVRVTAGDETSNEWVLGPGATAGPWEMVTSNVHGDGASVVRIDTQCGGGDGENYFLDGHDYLLEVTLRTPATCGDGGPNPLLVIHDLTTGTTRQI